MRNIISNLPEALVYQLKGLYYAEKKLSKAVPESARRVSFGPLKKEVKKYAESADDKTLKLERIFNFLLEEPNGGKNPVMDRLIDSMNTVLNNAVSDQVRDVMLISALQSISHYKIAGYNAALALAEELSLDAVAELLKEIVRWETATCKALFSLAVKEICLSPTPC